MKKVIIFTTAIVAFVCLTTNLSAQYLIPAYNAEIISDPTTFVESASDNMCRSEYCNYLWNFKSAEKKKLFVLLKNNSTTVASATFNIYSPEHDILYGPYTVTEGTLFTKELNADYIWRVDIIDCTINSTMNIWIEY